MTKEIESIAQLAWADIAAQLDQEGYAILPGLLGETQARTLAQLPGMPNAERGVSLASSDQGRGDLFHLALPLPEPLETWRAEFYRHLAPVANRWNEALDVAYRYPDTLIAFLARNRLAGQTRPQSTLSRLRVENYQTLHQHAGSEHVFPLQLVALLSEPEQDFIGGEFVMTEQCPRMQSRPMVLPLQLGDVAIITTVQRPFKSGKGYYCVNLKHAISRVRRGERIGLELLLHDAA